MPTQVQFRGGASEETSTFVGADREITVDTTTNTLRVHDGVTPGGHSPVVFGDEAGMVVEGDDVRLSDSRTPKGEAGGVLSGSYPNPTFSVDMATQAELDAVAGTKVDKVEGKGLSTNDLTDPLYDKLVGLGGTHWRGTFVSLSALEEGVTDPVAGDYADVDVVGEDVQRYIWDATDSAWVAMGGEVAPVTAAQVKQLYESNPDTNAFTDADAAALGGKLDANEWYLGTDKQHTANAAGAVDLDLAAASTFDLTLTGNATLTVSNAVVPAGETRSVVVRIRQGATAMTLTWWAGITWLASTTPEAPDADKIVEYVLSYDGSSWLGREGASN